jgi:hypothetical protein
VADPDTGRFLGLVTYGSLRGEGIAEPGASVELPPVPTPDTTTKYAYYDGVIFRSPGQGGHLWDRYRGDGEWRAATGALFPSEEEFLRMVTIPEGLALELRGLSYEGREAAFRRYRDADASGRPRFPSRSAP